MKFTKTLIGLVASVSAQGDDENAWCDPSNPICPFETQVCVQINITLKGEENARPQHYCVNNEWALGFQEQFGPDSYKK